jgi:hypothetical protein
VTESTASHLGLDLRVMMRELPAHHPAIRHAGVHRSLAALGAPDLGCEPDLAKRCGCPGEPTVGEFRQPRGCCERMTGEDLLCDACRRYCWTVIGSNARMNFGQVDGSGAPIYIDAGDVLMPTWQAHGLHRW